MAIRSDLRKFHFFEWTLEERKDLRKEIVEHLIHKFKINKATIQHILATGSRIYLVPDGSDFVTVFNPDSDLDIIVIIDTADFIQLVKQDSRAHYPMKTWEDAVKTAIVFSQVRISIFIMPPDSVHLSFYGFQLPNVDIITLKIDNLYKYDALDYILNIKSRIEPYTYCMVCETKKPCQYMFYYHLIDKDKGTVEAKAFHICHDCATQLFEGTSRYKVAEIFSERVTGNQGKFEKRVKKYINQHAGKKHTPKHHKTT